MIQKSFVDPFKKFSKSYLWELQETAYRQFGPSAWSEKGVPSYLTSNPWTANAYFQVIRGFIEDLMEKKIAGPLYIFDLGAGSGRFGYLFLKALEGFSSEGRAGQLNLHYVMTEIAEKNLLFLEKHPLLKPFIDKGILEFTYFKHSQESELLLYPSQKVWKASQAPVVLIGNYYFDTVPQALYRVESGELFDGEVSLKIEKREELIEALISDAKLTFSYKKSDDLKNSPWKNLLEEHVNELEGATFLFPEGAFETLAYFEKFAKGPCLLLAGDQAFATLEQLRKCGEPQLALHGTFSLPVSYYSIKRYIQQKGGEAWLPFRPDPSFTNLVGVISSDPSWEKTKNAFYQSIYFFDSWCYWKLIEQFETKVERLQDLLSLLRLGRGDPMTLHANFNKIREMIKNASSDEKETLLDLIGLSADYFFPIGLFDADFLVNLAVLCVDLEATSQAKKLLEKALSLGGHREIILNNLRAISPSS